MTDSWTVMEVKKFRSNGYITLPEQIQDKVVSESRVYDEIVYWSIVDVDEGQSGEPETYILLSNKQIPEDSDWLEKSNWTSVDDVDHTQPTEDSGVRPPAKALEEVYTEVDVEQYGGFLATDEMIEGGIDGTRFSYFLPGSQVEDLLPDNLGFGYSSEMSEEKLYEAAEMLPEFR